MDNLFFLAYQRLYLFVAKKRIAKNDLPPRFIHSHLVCVLATGLLMWAYAFLAYFTIKSPVPAIVGFTASAVHLLSPLLYRLNNRRFLNTNIFLGAGIVHQATFGFFCGGFSSNIIIWFGILPMLAGIVCGRRGIITWLIVCTFVTLGFLLLEVSGFNFPDEISPYGRLVAQALVTFGWIFTSSLVIWVCVFLVENHQAEVEAKKEGIQNLICVITHDLSTPISLILGRSHMLKKANLPEGADVLVNKILIATNNMAHIVNNVRNLYATELGKSKIAVELVNLDKLVAQLRDNFAEKLESKKLNLVVRNDRGDLKIKTNADLMVHQILGNLLSNAIKFSPEKSDIYILLEQKDGTTIITIKDSGIGIPKDLIARLFEIRGQTSRPGTSGETGTGFGLPIVKTYVEKLDGTISVISKAREGESLDHGTTFILEFVS